MICVMKGTYIFKHFKFQGLDPRLVFRLQTKQVEHHAVSHSVKFSYTALIVWTKSYPEALLFTNISMNHTCYR